MFGAVTGFFNTNKTTTPVSRGAGAADAGTQRVVEASDSPGAAGVGTTADAKATDGTSSWSAVALLKGLAHALLTAGGKVVEQQQPAAEDNANGLYAVLPKPVASSAYAPSSYVNFGSSVTGVVKAAAGNVYAIHVINRNAAVRYFQLHNKATAPANAEVPQQSWAVPAGTANNPGVLVLDSSYFAPSEFFAAGISWGFSTTEGTYTAATAADHSVRVRSV